MDIWILMDKLSIFWPTKKILNVVNIEDNTAEKANNTADIETHFSCIYTPSNVLFKYIFVQK